MTKQVKITTTKELINDAFLDEVPTMPSPDGTLIPLHRGIRPSGYYPINPYCWTPIDFSSLQFLQDQISQRVRIAPSHLFSLRKAKKFTVIARLERWVRYAQEILPTIFHPAVLSDLFSANMIINIKDFNEAQAKNPQETTSLFGSYIEILNVIHLYIPSLCTEVFVKELIANELTGAIFTQFREFTKYNPKKLPIPSLKVMNQKVLHAYKMGVARIDTFSRLLSDNRSYLGLTSQEKIQLRQYLRQLDQANYQQQHDEMFITRSLITALDNSGQFIKLDGGSTWHFIAANSKESNRTFYDVLYDSSQSLEFEQQHFLYKNNPDREKNITSLAEIFIANIRRSSHQHGDPLSITVNNDQALSFQFYSLSEAFSGIFEYPLPLIKAFFPEICHVLANMSCLPATSFCDPASFPTTGEALQTDIRSIEEIEPTQYQINPQEVKIVGKGRQETLPEIFFEKDIPAQGRPTPAAWKNWFNQTASSFLDSAINLSKFYVSCPIQEGLMLLQLFANKIGEYRDRDRAFNVDEQKKLKGYRQKFTELNQRLQPHLNVLRVFDEEFYSELQHIIKFLQCELIPADDLGKGPNLLLERVERMMTYLEKRAEWVNNWSKSAPSQLQTNNSFGFWPTNNSVFPHKYDSKCGSVSSTLSNWKPLGLGVT